MNAEPSVAEAPGRAARTREALRAAALARFVEDGFDAVTVVDIAADAGVTERTFFRHFASKEDVLYGDYERRLEWLRHALDERPTDEHVIDSVAASIRLFPDDPRMLIEVARWRESLLGRDRVARYLREVQGSVAIVIRDAAQRRRSPPSDSALVTTVWAEAIAAALFAAVTTWTEEEGGWDLDRLDELTSEALAEVRRGLR